MAYVPQGRMIFSHMTVLENIQTGLPASAKGKVPDELCCSRCSMTCAPARAATSPAASSSSWPLRARWPQSPRAAAG
jgi:ABC-type Fe3+/spermidine/putrescine transport system ATPase subunit